MKIYQKYQGRQKSTFKISKYVIILSTDLNITRLECKYINKKLPQVSVSSADISSDANKTSEIVFYIGNAHD